MQMQAHQAGTGAAHASGSRARQGRRVMLCRAASQDPLLLRVARGEGTCAVCLLACMRWCGRLRIFSHTEAERTPVWLMRQAGRYMAAFREWVYGVHASAHVLFLISLPYEHCARLFLGTKRQFLFLLCVLPALLLYALSSPQPGQAGCATCTVVTWPHAVMQSAQVPQLHAVQGRLWQPCHF